MKGEKANLNMPDSLLELERLGAAGRETGTSL